MTFQEEIKALVGDDVYERLDKGANNEVSFALKMPLTNEWGQEIYYNPRHITPALLNECFIFEEKGLKVSPLDIMHVLFKCKMLIAAKNEQEYSRRGGGRWNLEEEDFIISWSDRTKGAEALINEYLDRLRICRSEKTLLVNINSYNGDLSSIHRYFNQLFDELKYPFVSYLDEDTLVENYKTTCPNLREHDIVKAKEYFSYPSIGFSTYGTTQYCLWYSQAWLRTFLSLLKISAFVNPGQMDFGENGVEIVAPTSPAIMGSGSISCYSWDEDKKEPWEKIPDGCLWRSFGYRGITKMRIDSRNTQMIKVFMLQHRNIFEATKNPWDKLYLTQIAPTLDILSYATQVPDLGAKVLMIYCCLEHMFMPEKFRTDNKKYIVGGINAIKPDFLDWFDKLHASRCDYAHRGFIKRDEETLKLVKTSMKNVLVLLSNKLNSASPLRK